MEKTAPCTVNMTKLPEGQLAWVLAGHLFKNE